AILLLVREPDTTTAPVTAGTARPASTGAIAPPAVSVAMAPAVVDKAAPPPPAKTLAPAPSDQPSAQAATPPATLKPMGRLTFAIAPWGEVVVDGRKRGVSPPMQEVRLPPGRHTIEIRNTTFPAYRETVDVPADGVVRIKHKFS